MKCRKIKKLLSPFIDNQLSAKDKEIVQEHLKICPKCRRELEELKQLVNSLNTMDSYPAPPEIWAKVNKYAEKKKSSAWSFFIRPLPLKTSSVLNYVALSVIILLVAITASYLYLRIQPFKKFETKERTAAFKDIDSDDEKSLLKKPLALTQEEKKAEKRSVSQPSANVPESDKVAQDFNKEKSIEQLDIPSKGKEIVKKIATPQIADSDVRAEKKSKSLVAKRSKPSSPPEAQISEKAEAEKEASARVKTKIKTQYASKRIPEPTPDKHASVREEGKIQEEKLTTSPPAQDYQVSLKYPIGSLENPIQSKTDPLLEIIKRFEPTLPEKDKENLKSKNIVLELVVDKKGKVKKIKVIRSSGVETIDKAVMNAVKQWKFKPIIYDDQSVATKGKLTIKLK